MNQPSTEKKAADTTNSIKPSFSASSSFNFDDVTAVTEVSCSSSNSNSRTSAKALAAHNSFLDMVREYEMMVVEADADATA